MPFDLIVLLNDDFAIISLEKCCGLEHVFIVKLWKCGAVSQTYIVHKSLFKFEDSGSSGSVAVPKGLCSILS